MSDEGFQLHFEDSLEILQPRHILRFIRCLGSDRHTNVCIAKAWVESADEKTMVNIKITFFSLKDGKNTKYLYTDNTTYEKGCSNVTFLKLGEVINNPDKQRIYHCWHYCHDCKEAFMHTQAQMDFHKNHSFDTHPIDQESCLKEEE